MALTGLQIQKLLPKTNCKECGSNTCLAFAMKLAAKKTELSQCPYASEEAKQVLGAASEPPVRTIELGPERTLKIGGETVLYRHEKTFVHPTVLAVNVNDTDPVGLQNRTLQGIRDYVLVRVGETMRVDLVAITQLGSDPNAFAALASRAWETTKRPLVLRSPDIRALELAAVGVKGSRSLLCAANAADTEVLATVAKQNDHALAITANDLNQLVEVSTKLREEGFNDLVLQLPTHSLAERFQTNSILRRAALKDNFRPLGYPTLRFIESTNLFEGTVEAVNEINKYGGICILPSLNPAQLVSLLTLRQNIFTDPQKPIQVEPKVYAIGDPTPASPVFVTTNFSLTYFVVSGEIENSGTSAWLVVPECEGMSVLTAWAAGKFNGSTIARFIKEIHLDSQVESRELIIPGYVAQISGELEENLPSWKAIVGPQEASDLESFIKSRVVG
ncbi:MAG TPA: acetyl-CoA decarbonylase/synthase complex subunit gamma [Terriglobia bacterium]|nr:acetyl-CoA decarbonylase/synthase complex subunit gamma [Terriglobia bacterium]